MSGLRIAMTTLYLPGSSKMGVGHQVQALAAEMAGRGHEVTVFSPDRPDDDRPFSWTKVPGGPPVRLVRVPVHLRRRDWGEFDLVHGHGEDWLMSGAAVPPHVRTIYGSGFSEARRIRGARERARMSFIGLTEVVGSVVADRAVAISEATRRVYPWVSDVIPCGVDLQSFSGGGGPRSESVHPTILFVGTYANRKRGRLLWEAFRDVVRPAIPDAELWMVCEDAPAGPGVKVLGRLSQEDLVRRYRSAWVFCLPSSYEGFGVPYAEAMAAGTPVVATPNAGALEVLQQGRAGRMTSPDRLGQSLVEVLLDGHERAELARRGELRARSYDWSTVADRYERVYEETLEGRACTRQRARTQPPSDLPSVRGKGQIAGGESLIQRPALFASSFHPHLGGVEELVRQLALAQRDAGRDPIVHTMRWPRRLPASERWQDIEIRRHSFRSPEGGLRRTATAVVGNPIVLADVVRQLHKEHRDIVHVQCVSHGAWFAYQAARVLGLPFVASLQGELTMDADHVYERSASLRHTLRVILQGADQVTACSAAVLEEAELWAGISLGERGVVIHNGIDPSEFADRGDSGAFPTADHPYILAMGRHVHQKGFDILLDAFELATLGPGDSTLPPDWRLVIAGDGVERQRLETHAAALSARERIRFVGRADRSEVASLMGSASLFVLPSRHEPFGIVNLEAMAAGVPLIACDVGGVSEFVSDGVNGVLVPSEDAVALAHAVTGLANDPVRRSRLSAAGRKTAEQHSWSKIEDLYASVYETAKANNRVRR